MKWIAGAVRKINNIGRKKYVVTIGRNGMYFKKKIKSKMKYTKIYYSNKRRLFFANSLYK